MSEVWTGDSRCVPYMADCEKDGPRGPWVETRDKAGRVAGGHTGDLLPGSVNNAPDCHLNVPQALERFGQDKLVGVYFHIPSLTFTLVGISGAKVGIRSIDLGRGRSLLVSELRKRSEARGQA